MGENAPFLGKDSEITSFLVKMPLFWQKSPKYPILGENARFGQKCRILEENSPFGRKSGPDLLQAKSLRRHTRKNEAAEPLKKKVAAAPLGDIK